MVKRLETRNLGEDIPLQIRFNDPDTGDLVDPDDTDADAVPDATVTITGPDGTEHVLDAAMTHLSVGEFEYVWDTAVDAAGEGTYRASASAEFGGETKIELVEQPLRSVS